MIVKGQNDDTPAGIALVVEAKSKDEQASGVAVVRWRIAWPNPCHRSGHFTRTTIHILSVLGGFVAVNYVSQLHVSVRAREGVRSHAEAAKPRTVMTVCPCTPMSGSERYFAQIINLRFIFKH